MPSGSNKGFVVWMNWTDGMFKARASFLNFLATMQPRV